MLDEVLKIDLRTNAHIPTIDLKNEGVATDDTLVQAVLDGDESAFSEIFNRYKMPVTRTVGRFFRERSDVEEMVQQSFTKSYFSLKKYRGRVDRSFAAWITRITINVCYDEFRRRQRKGESLFSEMNDQENDYVSMVADGRQLSCVDSLVGSQLAEKILASLDPEDRVAMTLVYSEEFSIDEAAHFIGITTSSLKSRLFRCRNHIKRRFSHLFT